jgi:hydroxymethylglutaryl-CoA lyase
MTENGTRRRILIHEVGMRDGLQMEKEIVPAKKKLEWIGGLMRSGVDVVQVGSFVHPEKVPQMADTDSLFTRLTASGTLPHSVRLSALVLNEKGLERGLACGVQLFCMGVSASETHSRKNTGMPIAEATDRIIAMAQRAREAGKDVQVSVQSAFGCGYEGPVPQDRVLSIAARFRHAGLRTISLADTAGHATPDVVERMFSALRAADESAEYACHFHNTYGLGIANCYAAMRSGVTSFESSVAGLGGCPFTKIAGGNVCTEDFVHALHRMGLREDISLDALIAVANDISRFFGREMPGSVHKTGAIRETAAV